VICTKPKYFPGFFKLKQTACSPGFFQVEANGRQACLQFAQPSPDHLSCIDVMGTRPKCFLGYFQFEANGRQACPLFAQPSPDHVLSCLEPDRLIMFIAN